MESKDERLQKKIQEALAEIRELRAGRKDIADEIDGQNQTIVGARGVIAHHEQIISENEGVKKYPFEVDDGEDEDEDD